MNARTRVTHSGFLASFLACVALSACGGCGGGDPATPSGPATTARTVTLNASLSSPWGSPSCPTAGCS